jgi:hypothetical protein
MQCPVCNKTILEIRNNSTHSISKDDDEDHGADGSFQNLFTAIIPSVGATGFEGLESSSPPTWTVDARKSDCALRIAVIENVDDFQPGDDDFPTVVAIPIGSTLGPSSLPVLLFKADVELLADPALLTQSRQCDWSVFQLSRVIAQLVIHFQQRVCHHGILLNQRILTTLVQEVNEQGDCAFFNIIDMFGIIDHERLSTLGIVDEELFEVAAEEYAMSAPEFLKLASWETYHCQSPPKFRECKKWGHVLFLSHRWKERGVPGDTGELKVLQEAVRTYIDIALKRGATTTVKNFSSEQDFGVWLDYMMVPNHPSHAECDACRTRRHICIAKMAAIPTIATTIALHPDERSRGWILHELTMNTHTNIQDVHGEPVDIPCPHGARINLMVRNQVHFTNGSDGSALRCSEFLRLGQLPRNWPSVTKQLLQEWKEAGVRDERDAGPAKDILFKYARTFHFPCQKLKRAMMVWPQLLARRGVPKDDLDAWVYLSVEDRARPTGAAALPFLDRERKEASNFDWSSEAVFDFSVIEQEICEQEEAIKSLGISNELAKATTDLQRMQFVAMTMGLRAELLYGEAWLHWCHLSVLTESLTLCKRAIRLYDGVAVVQPTSCSVSFIKTVAQKNSSLSRRLLEQQQQQIVSTLARDTMTRGVSSDRLELALDCLGPALDPQNLPENNLSGYAPAWLDADEEDIS